MAGANRGLLIRQLDRLWSEGSLTGLHESQLLDRYVARRDELAFEALVVRHGPMVLALCRRMLRDPRDIEDAFQATFLILVRKAATIQNGERLSCWLYGVAFRVATRARQTAIRRRNRESTLNATAAELSSQPVTSTPIDHFDLAPILDQELARLPEKYRQPLILCYLDGNSHEQAAERLCWPVGTVRSRMARGRALLKVRLTRRGIAPMALSLGNGLTTSLPLLIEVVPGPLMTATVRAATQIGSTKFIHSAVVAGSVLTLTRGVLTTMHLGQLKWPVVGLLASTVFGGGAIAIGYATGPGPKRGPNADAVVVETQSRMGIASAVAPPSPKTPANLAQLFANLEPIELDLTGISENALFTRLEETLDQFDQASNGRTRVSPEALELGRQAIAISNRLQTFVDERRESVSNLTRQLNRAEAAVARAEERIEETSIAAERMKMLSSRRASLASPDDVLKATVDAELATKRLDQKRNDLDHCMREHGDQSRDLATAASRLELAQSRIGKVQPAPKTTRPAEVPLFPPSEAKPVQDPPAAKNPATSFAITPNPFELFIAQASRPTANISNLTIQMLILPLRQKLEELEKIDPAHARATELANLTSLRREIQQFQAMLRGLQDDLGSQIDELKQEAQALKLQTAVANAKLRAASAVLERNNRLNERKPGMVAKEDVAKAQAEFDLEATQHEIAQFKEKTLVRQGSQLETKYSTIDDILNRVDQALARTDPAPHRKAKP